MLKDIGLQLLNRLGIKEKEAVLKVFYLTTKDTKLTTKKH